MSAQEKHANPGRPQRVDYEEFLRTPVGALRRYVDRDARPLCGEAVIDDPVFRATIEQRGCHYAGSRHNHPLPMNASALKQMTKNWDEILATANALRTHLAAGSAAALSGGLALGMRVGYGGICLPLFLLYRARDPFGDGQVPGFVSGLHKASIDIATSIQLLLVESFKDGGAQVPPSDDVVQYILDFVEREGLLVGQKGVCAGPPQLIRELLEVMVHGRGRRLGDNSAVIDEFGDLTGIRSYVDELIKIWIGKHLVIAYNGRLMDALEAHSRAAGDSRLCAADVDARILEHRARESQPALISNVIARQERAARALDAAQYRRLLQTVQAVSAFLEWPAHREHAQRLIEHARGDPGSAEPAALAKLKPIVNGGVADDVVVAALLEAAKMEQLALRFFASTEANIKAALGLSGAPRSFSTDDLATVFGVMPRQYLGASLGIDSSVDANRIVFRGSGSVVLL